MFRYLVVMWCHTRSVVEFHTPTPAAWNCWWYCSTQSVQFQHCRIHVYVFCICLRLQLILSEDSCWILDVDFRLSLILKQVLFSCFNSFALSKCFISLLLCHLNFVPSISWNPNAVGILQLDNLLCTNYYGLTMHVYVRFRFAGTWWFTTDITPWGTVIAGT